MAAARNGSRYCHPKSVGPAIAIGERVDTDPLRMCPSAHLDNCRELVRVEFGVTWDPFIEAADEAKRADVNIIK